MKRHIYGIIIKAVKQTQMTETRPKSYDLKTEIKSANFIGETNQQKLLENFDKLTDQQKIKIKELLIAEKLKYLENINKELNEEKTLLNKFEKRKDILKENLNRNIDILSINTNEIDLEIDQETLINQIDEVILLNNQINDSLKDFMSTLSEEEKKHINRLKDVDLLINQMPEDIKNYYENNKNVQRK